MKTFLTDESSRRFLVFVAVLGTLAIAEALRPRRARSLRRSQRWPHNLALVATGTVAMRVAAPAGVATLALWAEGRGLGLLPRLDAPVWVAWSATVAALDLAVYAQHVAMHKVPVLWRLHRVHHADVDVDVTTGVRFHPVELLLSLLLKGGTAVLVGAPPGAVILFEILLNATSMFSHTNLRMPTLVDRALRLVVVTPDMHRVHHSVDLEEAQHNYGFNLPWWDWVFRTYKAQPALPHDTMPLGIGAFDDAHAQRIDRLLVQPLLDDGNTETQNAER